MKVHSIAVVPNTLKSNSTTKGQANSPSLVNREFVYASYPINFTASPCNMETLFNVKGLPCPQCGKGIIPKFEFEELSRSFKGWESDFQSGLLIAQQYTAKMLSSLMPFKKDLQPIEESILRRLSAANEAKPNKTIQELMMDMRPEALKNLHLTELDVLKEVENLGRCLPEKVNQRLMDIVEEGRRLITQDETGRPFRRKAFLTEVNSLNVKSPDGRDILHSINDLLNHFLPSSNNDANAFIVKYSQAKKHGNERVTSADIATRLILGSSPTVDHLHPRALGGEDINPNKAVTCFHCNNGKTNIPFRHWLTGHPDALTNFQRYADKIIAEINAGKLENNGYLEALRETLLKLSKGTIILDLSEIKVTC